MRRALCFLGLFFLSGCALRSSFLLEESQKAGQIPLGASRAEVKRSMKDAVVIGYQKAGENTQEFIPVTLKNPCRIDIIKTQDQNKYEVIFYFVRIKYQDGAITDDELMPFVFKEDRLIGKGWDFLDRLQKFSLSHRNFPPGAGLS